MRKATWAKAGSKDRSSGQSFIEINGPGKGWVFELGDIVTRGPEAGSEKLNRLPC